jgi:hypothetical protein
MLSIPVHQAWCLPTEVHDDEEAIAEAALQAAFTLIHERLAGHGYPASGDVMPGEQEYLTEHFRAFVRMAALNNPIISEMNRED